MSTADIQFKYYVVVENTLGGYAFGSLPTCDVFEWGHKNIPEGR